jgi:hypothetical protein
MARYRSVRHAPHRAERRSSYRFLVTALLTTTMVATGGFGTLPENPVTQALQEEIGQNIPEPLLNPLNSYLEQLSAPTIQPQPASNPNPPLDLVGFLLDDTTPEASVSVSENGTGDETTTPTESPTGVGTQTITETPSTRTATPTRISTGTFTPTATLTSTATTAPTCSVPSTTAANTTFFNSSLQTIEVYWIDFSCRLVLYVTLAPGQSSIQGTYIGYRWWFVDSATSHLMADYVVSSANDVVDVSTGAFTTATPTPTPTLTPTRTAIPIASSTAAPSAGFYVSAVDLNGSGSVATVPPGQPFTVAYTFQVFSDPCPGCITQLITGLGFAGSSGEWCAYDGIPGPLPGATGTENNTLVAPSTPGTYSVVVEYHWQYTCSDALGLYGSGGFVTSRVIGQVIVP